MSYFRMDHAGCVERNIAASKRFPMTAKDRRAQAARKGWFAAPDVLNPFQRRAMDILGIVGGGIYNAPISWDAMQWSAKYVVVPWRNPLSTWDFSALTLFVFLCHEARIRGEVAARGFRYVEISLHERVADGGSMRRHPTLDEAIASFREQLGDNHPIAYCAPVQTEAAE